MRTPPGDIPVPPVITDWRHRVSSSRGVRFLDCLLASAKYSIVNQGCQANVDIALESCSSLIA
jgi:hypothetical protein